MLYLKVACNCLRHLTFFPIGFVGIELPITELATEGANRATDNPFSLLPAYLHGLGESNPGSLIEIKTVVNGKGVSMFKYLFVAFAASLEGFASIRRVIVIDRTQLKGKYGGCLLIGSCEDANFQLFPLAFAVVDSENDDAWEWFFWELSRAVPDTTNLSFVSDRHSSIYKGLRRVSFKLVRLEYFTNISKFELPDMQ